MFLVEILKHFVVGVFGASIDHSWQNLTEDSQLLWCEFSSFGHDDLEFHNKIATLFFIFVERHSKPFDYLLFVVAYDFSGTGIESVLLAIEMGQFEVKA